MRYAIWSDMSATWKALESVLPAARTTLANTAAQLAEVFSAIGVAYLQAWLLKLYAHIGLFFNTFSVNYFIVSNQFDNNNYYAHKN